MDKEEEDPTEGEMLTVDSILTSSVNIIDAKYLATRLKYVVKECEIKESPEVTRTLLQL